MTNVNWTLNLQKDYPPHKQGKPVKIDRIAMDTTYAGGWKVRVTSIRKRPYWMALTWFVR